jgi:hypothetical protein
MNPRNQLTTPTKTLLPIGWIAEMWRLLSRSLRFHPLLFIGSGCIAGSWVTEKVVTESNREKALFINNEMSELWRHETQAVENQWRTVNLVLHDTSHVTPIEYKDKLFLATSQELDCYYGLRESGKKICDGEDSAEAATKQYVDSAAKNDALNKAEDLSSIIHLLNANRDWYSANQKLIKSCAYQKTHKLQAENDNIRNVFIILVILGTCLIQINNARERENENLQKKHLERIVEKLAARRH